MNESGFKSMFECKWEPSKESIILGEALDKYYRESEFVDNKTARKMWRELRENARMMGITSSQFQHAKMRAVGGIK